MCSRKCCCTSAWNCLLTRSRLQQELTRSRVWVRNPSRTLLCIVTDKDRKTSTKIIHLTSAGSWKNANWGKCTIFLGKRDEVLLWQVWTGASVQIVKLKMWIWVPSRSIDGEVTVTAYSYSRIDRYKDFLTFMKGECRFSSFTWQQKICSLVQKPGSAYDLLRLYFGLCPQTPPHTPH